MRSPITLIILLLAVLSYIRTQVLGIDFGTEFWKAALISPGKNLVIVENSRSERKTLNSIAFQDGIRYFEQQSKAKRLKKPQLSYFYLNKLIKSLDSGIPVSGHTLQHGTYIFQSHTGQKQKEQSMTLEQVVGMILKNIKQLASLQAGTDIRDVVLSVPASWGFHAKMSLVNAAYLADFSVLGLVNENSAAAIQYAISRNDTDPINVIIFNYGSHNLQLSIIRAWGHFSEQKNKTIESIEALAHTTVEDVGGLKVDQQIANYLAEQFAKKHKLDAKKNKKSWTKLMVQAAEVKETLSANKEANAYIEGLMDGIDLNIQVSRDVIESCPHFKEFPNYIDQILTKAALTKTDIHSVQIIGGASRIPKVTTLIREYFAGNEGVDVGSHINGDESVAFGAALRAANLSLTFRVKQLYFYDPMNLDTRVVVSSPDKGVIVEQTLFHLRDHHGAKKTLNIAHNDQDLKITVYVGEEIVKEFATKGLGDWKKRHQNDNITGEPNLLMEFMMSSVHIAELKDIYVNVTINQTSVREKVEYVDEEVEIQEVVNVKEKGETTEEKKDEGEEKKQEKEQQKQQQKQDSQTEEGKQKNQTQKTIKKKINKTKTIKKQVEQHEIRPKKHTTPYEQTFSKYKRYSKDQAEQKRKLLHQYQAHQKGIKEKAKIRNDFESALYSLKNSFEETYLKTFSKENELTKLIDTVTKELEWLDQNAWTASKENFEEHFKILSEAYHPIHNRSTEYRNREKTYNESMGYLGMVYQKTSDLLTSHIWIKQKVEAHLKKVNDTADWIVEKLKKQMEKALNQDPILFNHEMIQKAQELRNEYYILKMTPRPKIDDLLKDFKDFKKKYENDFKDKKTDGEKKEQQEKKESEEKKTDRTEESEQNPSTEQPEEQAKQEEL